MPGRRSRVVRDALGSVPSDNEEAEAGNRQGDGIIQMILNEI